MTSATPKSECSEARRYAANVSWLLIADVLGKISSLVFIVVVARSVGTSEFGYFSFALSFVPLFLVLGRAGIQTTMVREIARDRSRLSEVFASGLALRLTLALAGLGLALALGPFFVSGGRTYLILVLVGTALFFDEVSGFVVTVFNAFEQMEYVAAVGTVNRFLSTGFAGVAVLLGHGLVAVCFAYFAGSAIGVAIGFGLLWWKFPPIDYTRVRMSVAGALLRTGVPLGVAGILNTALFRIDTVLLEGFKGPVEVAFYNVAYRFFESSLFLAWSLGTLALPRISRARDSRQAARELGVATSLSLAFYLPIAVTVPFCGAWLVDLVFSDRYAPAATAVGILAASATPYAIAYMSRMALIGIHQIRVIVISAAIALAVNVGLNLYLIPADGFRGAAWSTFAAEIVEAVLLGWFFLRANTVFPSLRVFAVPAAATAVLAVVLLAAGWEGARAFALALIVYPLAAIASALVLTPDEIRRARARWNPRPSPE